MRVRFSRLLARTGVITSNPITGGKAIYHQLSSSVLFWVGRCLGAVGQSAAARDLYLLQFSVAEDVMRIVPVVKSSDLQRSLNFYTGILDFKWKWAGYEDSEMANGVVDLVRDGAELQLSRHSGDGVFGSVIRVFVDDVDERYQT